MKNIWITTTIIVFICIIGLLILPDTVLSQPPPPPSKPTQTPIDGGLGLLAAAGSIYAIKKLKQKKS